MNVWLTYSREDSQIVDKVRDKLVDIQNVQIFTLDSDLKPGDIIVEKIRELIKNSQIFLIFISKNSKKDEKFPPEIALILSEWEKDLTKKIIPIILDKEAKETLPPFLNRFQWSDLSKADKFSNELDLLIKSIDKYSRRTFVESEFTDVQVNKDYKDYLDQNIVLLESQKSQYKVESQKKFKKLLFYLIIYLYIVIIIVTVIYLTKIIPITIFTIFVFIFGMILGGVANVLYTEYYKKINKGVPK